MGKSAYEKPRHHEIFLSFDHLWEYQLALLFERVNQSKSWRYMVVPDPQMIACIGYKSGHGGGKLQSR